MIENIFEKTGVNKYAKALTVSTYRQRVIAGNVANATTPGYTKKELNFEDNLSKAMGKTGMRGLRADERHLRIGDAKISQEPITIEDADQPNVDIEKEMAASAENQLLYSTVAKVISGKFRALRTVIRGRG